ncbi:MAG: DUF333 domain-containing protein [Patescibacteria group bacterium]
MNHKIILGIAGGIVIAALGFGVYLAVTNFSIIKNIDLGQDADEGKIENFDECAAAGNPVMESYPRQCRTADGRLFVEEIDEDEWEFDSEWGVDYEVRGCDEEKLRDPLAQEKKDRIADMTIDGNYVNFTHYLNYVCCADIEVEIMDTVVEDDKTTIKLLESNTGEMCRCVCDYEVDITLGYLDPFKYTVEMYGVEFEGEQEPQLLWSRDFQIIESEEDGAGIGLANPASAYCQDWGGTVDIRHFIDGDKGFCLFEDGSECEEWAFYRDECWDGEVFCKDLCGDGQCREIVCEAVGCPCSETAESCPADCQ